jgi:probable HAF family extracellular repeat protein
MLFLYIRRVARGFALLSCLAIAVSNGWSQPKYKVTVLSSATSGGAPANGINDAGQVVGGEGWENGTGPGYGAFLWTSGTITPLPTLSGYSKATAGRINNNGQIAGVASGGSGRSGNPEDQAIIWNGGVPTSLGCAGDECGQWTAVSYSAAINNSGQIVGYVDTGAVSFLYTGGSMTPFNLTGQDCFTLPAGTPCTVTVASAINDQGQITGNTQLEGAGT